MNFCIVILILFLINPVFQAGKIFSGKCVGVIDGDTIEVLKEGRAIRIRLEGVDCPESGQDFSTRAKQFTSNLVFNKVVTVIEKEKDQYGRTVARVMADKQDVSAQLIIAGLAWHYKEYSNDFVLAELELRAREEKAGLWAVSNPIPPWNFRRGERTNMEEVDASATGDLVYHGNVRSKVFHQPGCPDYNCKNCTREFQSRDEAIQAGFRPCGRCNP
jgi:micrococcal nuclease